MAALTEAIVGPWSAREVQDTVRRLRDVGELARRQDGTFVLTERTAKETRQADRDPDEAVRRIADRARRAATRPRSGCGGRPGTAARVLPSVPQAGATPAGRPLPGMR